MKSLRPLRARLDAQLQAWGNKCVITGWSENLEGEAPHRALVSYVVLPLLPPSRFRDRRRFGNRGLAQELVRALNELGYVVDIVHLGNRKWIPAKQYDLFIGHAGENFERLSAHLPEATTRVYFSTGVYWAEFNRREAGRLLGMADRTGFLLPPDRAIRFSEEGACRAADGIICLGEGAASTYQGFPSVESVDNATFPTEWSGWRDKDVGSSREHFLFFSGGGNIHKGLDILLEAFLAHPDLHLHVCQRIEPEFGRVYARALYESPNIHVHGFTKMRSPEFYRLATICGWVVSGTCTDAQPNSVIECMAHGLVPILPSAANLDIGGHGVIVPDCNVGSIGDAIRGAAGISAKGYGELSRQTALWTAERYTPDNFRTGFSRAVEAIIRRKKEASVETDQS